MYVFSLITWFFLTCSNTTPTITIFISLLFDRAVSMVKHIMEIVNSGQGEHCVYQRWSNPPYLACFILFGDHFSVHYWLNWVHEDD